jgi:single-strand DNA-binding protein
MNMSINKVLISGNLTRDPELRATASGMPVLGLGVAVNDRRKNQSTGEWEDYPNFIDCTMFGSRAESVSNYLSKGSKVAIEGKLRWSQWERDGQKRSKIEVIIDEIEFLSSRSSFVPEPPSADGGDKVPSIPPAPEVTVYDEDIPF